MKSLRCYGAALLFAVGGVILAPSVSEARPRPGPLNEENFGEVHFPISCQTAVQASFNRAVAILHSFWYERARSEFEKVAARDPACAMAYWGIAMTYWHPHWDPPGASELEKGWAAVEKAESLPAGTPRERAFIDAIAAYYRDGRQHNPRARALAFQQAMQKNYRTYPGDVEAACFYGLALFATALTDDKTYANQREAGRILERVSREHPDHPGAAHYIIHSYDHAPLAAQALPAARRYGQIAPAASHAVHMPSHIYTQLGMWEDSIRANLASIAVARRAQAGGHPGTDDELHASRYLTYAYLQRGEQRAAADVLERVRALGMASHSGAAGMLHGSTITFAVQSALERHAWAEAAAIAPTEGMSTGSLMLVHWARALGSARGGDVAGARKATDELQALYDREFREDREGMEWHAGEIELQEARAWLAQAEGQSDRAVELMKDIAEKEKAGRVVLLIDPPILPPREQLGDLLLEQKRPKEALAEYQAALAAAPHRLDGLYGAARAAELSGNHAEARRYFAELERLCGDADPAFPALVEAREFLAAN